MLVILTILALLLGCVTYAIGFDISRVFRAADPDAPRPVWPESRGWWWPVLRVSPSHRRQFVATVVVSVVQIAVCAIGGVRSWGIVVASAGGPPNGFSLNSLVYFLGFALLGINSVAHLVLATIVYAKLGPGPTWDEIEARRNEERAKRS